MRYTYGWLMSMCIYSYQSLVLLKPCAHLQYLKASERFLWIVFIDRRLREDSDKVATWVRISSCEIDAVVAVLILCSMSDTFGHYKMPPCARRSWWR